MFAVYLGTTPNYYRIRNPQATPAGVCHGGAITRRSRRVWSGSPTGETCNNGDPVWEFVRMTGLRLSHHLYASLEDETAHTFRVCDMRPRKDDPCPGGPGSRLYKRTWRATDTGETDENNRAVWRFERRK